MSPGLIRWLTVPHGIDVLQDIGQSIVPFGGNALHPESGFNVITGRSCALRIVRNPRADPEGISFGSEAMVFVYHATQFDMGQASLADESC